MTNHSTARRLFAAVTLLLAAGFGCKSTPSQEGQAAAATPPPEADSSISVGFVYVGSRGDYGYNQAHAEGAKAVQAPMPRIADAFSGAAWSGQRPRTSGRKCFT
jgi:basic membrane lipoprotein Med (substrate-binding protein (PBP1-ABC) superfamily)